jgi:uncharacterized protein YidB (DUF937 family)
MGLFDAVLSAVSNPGQQASPDQFGAILNTVQQLSSNHGIDASTTQTLVSVVGGYVQSALQQQQSTAGTAQVQSTVNQYSGTGPNPQAVEAVLGPALQQQAVQDLIQRTGLDPQTVESLLPTLVPLALNFLQSGQHTGNSQAGNPVLTAFLDGNHDGNLDLGDALSMAGQFFGR